MSDLSGWRTAMVPKLPNLETPSTHSSGAISEIKAKIDKSSRDFESVLLNNWLQGAYASFGSVPGGDDDDADSGKEQLQGIAIQSLSSAMTAAGGIGISKMITEELTKADEVHKSAQTIDVAGCSAKNWTVDLKSCEPLADR